MNVKPKTFATCHPDKPNVSGGLCNNCYQKQYNKEHPEMRSKIDKKYYDSHPKEMLAKRDKWWKENPDYHLQRRYDINAVQYEQQLKIQGQHCALCPTTPEENGKALAVDHNHSCCPGRECCGHCLRGLLCEICNKKLGNFEKFVAQTISVEFTPNSWEEKAFEYIQYN